MSMRMFGLMSGEGKRGRWPRLNATAPFLNSTAKTETEAFIRKPSESRASALAAGDVGLEFLHRGEAQPAVGGLGFDRAIGEQHVFPGAGVVARDDFRRGLGRGAGSAAAAAGSLAGASTWTCAAGAGENTKMRLSRAITAVIAQIPQLALSMITPHTA